MVLNKTQNYWLLLFLLQLVGFSSHAQYSFHQSFTGFDALSKQGWSVYSPDDLIRRSDANGYAAGGKGSLKMDFYKARPGTTDSLETPVLSSSTIGDTLSFDHAHVMDVVGNGDQDSMQVYYSTDGGASYHLLASYVADPLAAFTSLSTVPQPSISIGVPFEPFGPHQWSTKKQELPAGTNRIKFLFYATGGDNLFLDNITVGQTPLVCSGLPFISDISGELLLCTGEEFAITPDTFELNPYITYQWQQSADSGVTDPWTNIAGATNAELIETFNGTAYYRLEATCTSTNQVTVSSVYKVSNASFYQCYCKGTMGGACGDPDRPIISLVTFPSGSLNNPSACNGTITSSYTQYPVSPTTTDTLVAGSFLNEIAITHTNGYANVYMWIDHNRNGIFENAEYYALGFIEPTGYYTYKFNMPLTALTGQTGMRIRVTDAFYVLDSADACSFRDGGETEDYIIYQEAAPVCAGAPQGGSIGVPKVVRCPSDKLQIRVNDFGFGQGITYQWEESDDNGVTDPFESVTDGEVIEEAIYRPKVKSDTVYYRFKVMCLNTNDSAYSDVTQVITKPGYECYCTDNLSGGECNPDNPYISFVEISGSRISNPSSCSANPQSYTNYAFGPNAYDTLEKGSTFEIKVAAEIGRTVIAVWLDLDGNGEFDPHEGTRLANFNAPGDTASAFITIPNKPDVTTGYIGMRVKTSLAGDFMSASDACTGYRYGETEDYVLYIKEGPLCTGSPTTGTYEDTLYTCFGNTVTVTAVGSSYGDSIVYEWQESDDNGIFDTWEPVTTGTGFDGRQFTSDVITDTIFYRLRVLCNTTGMSTLGDPVMIAFNPMYLCYCSDNLGGSGAAACESGNYIINVSITGSNGTRLNNNSVCHPNSNDQNYTRYLPAANTTDTLVAGEIYKLSVITNTTGGEGVAVWIDMNGNGSFEREEYVLVTKNVTRGFADTVSIVIPNGSYEGYVGMRVRMDCEFCLAVEPTGACESIIQGETEDYIVYLKAAEPCTGVPDAGMIASEQTICPGAVFKLESPGATALGGIRYQWEESDDNGITDPWSNIDPTDGDTTRFVNLVTFNEKYYRLKVSCTYAATDAYSNAMHVTFDSAYSCYTPGADFGGGSCALDVHMTRVNIRNTTLDNYTACQETPFQGVYAKYAPTGSATATLVRGKLYEIEVMPSGFSDQSVGVWIDFNGNRDYEINEFISFGSGNVLTSTLSEINVPTNAVTGYTGMRVRTRRDQFGFGIIRATDMSTTFSNGETEDYVIYIDSLKQATDVIVHHETGSTITVSWNRGNGDNTMVLAKKQVTLITDPVDGVVYAADTKFNSFAGDSTAEGNYIVYNGTDTFVTVTDLDQYTSYEFYVYENAGAGAFRTYVFPGVQVIGGTLPVTWLSFDAYHTNGQEATLVWTTASEKNNRGFYAERSTDGVRFEEIGFVKGLNASSVTKYAFNDAQAFASAKRVYYRLRQVDFDGTSAYSKTVSVNTAMEQAAVSVKPNPFTHQLSVVMKEFTAGEHCEVEMFNLLGQTVRKKHIVMDTNGSVELHNLDDLENGMYILQVRRAGQLENFRLLKQ